MRRFSKHFLPYVFAIGLILGGTYLLARQPKPTPKPPSPVCARAAQLLAGSTPVAPYSLGRCQVILGTPGNGINATFVAVRGCYFVEYIDKNGSGQIVNSQAVPVRYCR